MNTPIPDRADHLLIDGVLRSTINSEGHPLSWSIEGLSNFWRWFGNSQAVSKEDNGIPLVVYHNEREDGGKLDLNKLNRGAGFNFCSERQASLHGEPIPYILSMRTPHYANAMENAKHAGKPGVIRRAWYSHIRDKFWDSVIFDGEEPTYVVFDASQIRPAYWIGEPSLKPLFTQRESQEREKEADLDDCIGPSM